ncbi:MAG: hypothetical protein LBC77_09435 [Spirochaetaceae bacterium]|jgi:hypothetical protein|nr:hypothetical protein [Spirochaetaceae bacterium]
MNADKWLLLICFLAGQFLGIVIGTTLAKNKYFEKGYHAAYSHIAEYIREKKLLEEGKP